MAPEEGVSVGKTRIVGPATGGNGETSLMLAPPPRGVLRSKGRNIGDGWLSADDPVAGPLAPAEVRQAVVPCSSYLC